MIIILKSLFRGLDSINQYSMACQYLGTRAVAADLLRGVESKPGPVGWRALAQRAEAAATPTAEGGWEKTTTRLAESGSGGVGGEAGAEPRRPREPDGARSLRRRRHRAAGWQTSRPRSRDCSFGARPSAVPEPPEKSYKKGSGQEIFRIAEITKLEKEGFSRYVTLQR